MPPFYRRVEKITYIAFGTSALIALMGQCLPERRPPAFLPQDLTTPHGAVITPHCAIAIDDAAIARRPVAHPDCTPALGHYRLHSPRPEPHPWPPKPLKQANARDHLTR